jgi:beta-phosphoglucomutase-like phosphatase (HAD superfamily)
MNNPIEAVIFDFNGTLFYDSHFHKDAWSDFAKLHGLQVYPDDFDNHIHGFTNKEIIEYLFQREPEKNELQELYEEKEAIYRKICEKHPDSCILTPGAKEFLNYLLLNGMQRNIATASYLPNVELYFRMFDLTRWFSRDHVVFDSGEYRGKPHPDLFLAAAEKINYPINHCMIIEDSISGIMAAKNAGAGKIVAVNFDSNPDKFASYDFIDAVISDFRQLIGP